MTLQDRLDRLVAGWRGPLLAALIALAAALPGALALPPLDRDEARFAEASAQMLESGDYITMRFQQTPRFKKPVGVYWLQALASRILSPGDTRRIWVYRVPSLLGVMLAAAACAWGAAAFLRPGLAFAAGAIVATSLLASTEALIASADGVLLGLVTLAMAALGRIYLAARGGPAAGRGTRIAFWIALSLSVLIKGPIGPMVAGLTILALAMWERKGAWLKGLGWGWGLILVVAVNGPWAMAITVATDGAFWGGAVGQDLATKLATGQEGHGAPPGFYALLSPLLLFPATLLLPAAVVAATKFAREPAMRFAICWLVPSWLVFEAVPTKLVHYVLPTFGAIAWIMARALGAGLGRLAVLFGAVLALVAAVILAAVGPIAMLRLHDDSALPWVTMTAALLIAVGFAGAALLARGRPGQALAAAAALALAGHVVLTAGLAPAFRSLWLSARAARALTRAGWSPRQGAPGPVTVAGYAEPSIVFLLGADTELGDGADAAQAIAEGRPAIVEGREDAAFHEALAKDGAAATVNGEGAGLDYSNNRHDILRIYAPLTR